MRSNRNIERLVKKNPNLNPIVKCICNIADPEKIILFGSLSRGDNESGSDIDLLVIKSGTYDPIRLLGDIYVNLHGIRQPVDIVICSPDEIEKFGKKNYSALYPALSEGTIIYENEMVSR